MTMYRYIPRFAAAVASALVLAIAGVLSVAGTAAATTAVDKGSTISTLKSGGFVYQEEEGTGDEPVDEGEPTDGEGDPPAEEGDAE